MILSAQSIAAIKPPVLDPFVSGKIVFDGVSYGLGPAGYDVRVSENLDLMPGDFTLASTMERFQMPDDVLATVHDKSTFARLGIAVQTTVIEPGWSGFLTIEITNHGRERVRIKKGTGIAQIIFHRLDQPTDRPYAGKYQDQGPLPQEAIRENVA